MGKKVDNENIRWKAITEKLPGLFLAIIIAFLGRYLANWVPNLGGVTIAILLGMIVGNIFDLGDSYIPGVRFAEKKILSLVGLPIGVHLFLQLRLLACLL